MKLKIINLQLKVLAQKRSKWWFGPKWHPNFSKIALVWHVYRFHSSTNEATIYNLHINGGYCQNMALVRAAIGDTNRASSKLAIDTQRSYLELMKLPKKSVLVAVTAEDTVVVPLTSVISWRDYWIALWNIGWVTNSQPNLEGPRATGVELTNSSDLIRWEYLF